VQKSEDAWSSRGGQNQEGPKSETLANGNEAKSNAEKGLEVVVVKQTNAQDEETEVRTEAVASSQQQPNRTIRFLQD
jgi:hypothetical protein